MRYFLSAERKELDWEVNVDRTVALLDGLELSFNTRMRQAEGRYFGSGEVSYEVRVLSKQEAEYVARLAFDRFDQESMLEVAPDNRANLVYADGRREYVGIWTRVSEAVAKAKDCWTRIGNQYYVTVLE